MKRNSNVNRLYTRPVLTKAVRVPNELSFEEPVNPLLKYPLKQGQPDQTPLIARKMNEDNVDRIRFDETEPQKKQEKK